MKENANRWKGGRKFKFGRTQKSDKLRKYDLALLKGWRGVSLSSRLVQAISRADNQNK